jgi:hypothetical protein
MPTEDKLIDEPKPLFQRDLSSMPLQIPDKETAVNMWLEGNPEPIHIQEFFPGFKSLDYKSYQCYLADDDWFIDPNHRNSIHGKRHLDRTTLYALILAQLTGLSKKDTEVLAIFGSIHDLGRQDDRKDSEHGLRSANHFVDKLVEKYKQRGIILITSKLRPSLP